MAALGEAVPCLSCGRQTFWERNGVRGRLRLMEVQGRRTIGHLCRPLCGAWMPNAREHCARFAGHSGTARYPDHRTRYAMDCALRARRGGWAA